MGFKPDLDDQMVSFSALSVLESGQRMTIPVVDYCLSEEVFFLQFDRYMAVCIAGVDVLIARDQVL